MNLPHENEATMAADESEVSTSTTTTSTTKASRPIHHHSHFSKYDSDMASNEFSTEMHTPEIIVVILILCLWVLSLRKLVKHFDKLRSTQYREIPYKYHLKDPENIGNVKIVNNQNESVIYSRDPVKSLRSKSIACGDFVTSNNRHSLGLFGRKSINETKKKSLVESMLFGANKLNTAGPVSINYKKNLSNSLNSMSNYDVQRQYRNYSMSHVTCMRPNIPRSTLGSRASYVDYTSIDIEDPSNPNKLDPAFLLPIVVRRSLLDLHRKSVENLAAAAASCVPTRETISMGLTPGPEEGISTVTSMRAAKSPRKFNFGSLRPPKLNLERKSSNVTSDSTNSVKVSESPV